MFVLVLWEQKSCLIVFVEVKYLVECGSKEKSFYESVLFEGDKRRLKFHSSSHGHLYFFYKQEINVL